MTSLDMAIRLELEKAAWTLRATSLGTIGAGGYLAITGGIPGLVGGASLMGIGAFGVGTSFVFEKAIDNYYEENFR